jgi:hypothetical protein
MPSPKEFIERWPLYTRTDIRNFSAPRSISRMCNNSKCKRETTWELTASPNSVSTGGPNFTYALYFCVLCHETTLLVIYETLDWKEVPNTPTYAYHAVRKIGQLPAPSVDIPAGLSERLGATAGYYKNALVCRAQNFGIAAVAYMRRVIEEKTDELIDVVVELAKTYGVDQKTVEALMKAKEQVQYEQKVKVASEVIPDALKPGGVNPFGQLYKHLSIGVHGRTDDECIAICDDLKDDFEYVFRNLYVQARDAKEFAQRVQQRAGKQVL